MGAVAAVYGKHPDLGDFLVAGLEPPLARLIEDWLNGTLTDLRTAWGEGWQPAFDRGPAVRLWIGPALAGGTGFAGVLVPSRDRVGRRFPLVAGITGPGIAPPSVDPSQGLYEAVEAFLPGWRHADARDGEGGAAGAMRSALGRALADVLPGIPDAAEGKAAASAALWARHPRGDVERLWSDATQADHHAAALSRAYLWIAGTPGRTGTSDGAGTPEETARDTAKAPAAMFADAHLPGAGVLGWLLSGAPALPGQDMDATPPAHEDAASQAPSAPPDTAAGGVPT
ncbi:MAG: type VI secretion system-associated protein TagF [Rubellimicrobium sp.]|nr:type VI secretion system-associated protein TagF [Rubellimicrobium sp.]